MQPPISHPGRDVDHYVVQGNNFEWLAYGQLESSDNYFCLDSWGDVLEINVVPEIDDYSCKL